jgi:hypothetical protein
VYLGQAGHAGDTHDAAADCAALGNIQVHQRAPPHGCLSQGKCPVFCSFFLHPNNKKEEGKTKISKNKFHKIVKLFLFLYRYRKKLEPMFKEYKHF